MKLIAAVSVDGAIGHDDKLLWHISEDLKRYKEKTLNNILIVGRITYESLPLKALGGRTHIVVSKNEIDIPHGLDVYKCNTIEEAIKKAKELQRDNEIIVIGGSKMYDSTIHLCDEAIITWVNKEFPEANKRFPIDILFNDFYIGEDTSWSKTNEGVIYKYTNYLKEEL